MNERISSDELERILLHLPEVKTCPRAIPEIQNVLDGMAAEAGEVMPDLPPAFIDDITKDANEILNSISMTPDTASTYMSWYEWVYSALENFPVVLPFVNNRVVYCHLDIFGSFRTGLITNSGDLDCTVMLLQNPFNNVCQIINGIPYVQCNSIVDISGQNTDEVFENVTLVLRAVKERLEERAKEQGIAVKEDHEEPGPQLHFSRSKFANSIVRRSTDSEDNDEHGNDADIVIIDLNNEDPQESDGTTEKVPQTCNDKDGDGCATKNNKEDEADTSVKSKHEASNNLTVSGTGNKRSKNVSYAKASASERGEGKKEEEEEGDDLFIKITMTVAHISILQFQLFKGDRRIVKIEMSINNFLPFINTSYLLMCRQVECSHFVPLALIVKYWAKQRQISTPSNFFLAPYAFTLLVLYYLQTRDTSEYSLENYSLGALIYGFFRFYAYEWPRMVDKYVVSVNVNNMCPPGMAVSDDKSAFPILTRKRTGWGVYLSSEYMGDVQTTVDELDKMGYFKRLLPGIIPPKIIFKSCKKRPLVIVDPEEALDEEISEGVIWMMPNVASSIPAPGTYCEPKKESHYFPIADPFEPDRDLGALLVNKTYMLTMAEFRRAVGILRRGGPSQSKSWKNRKDTSSKSKNDKNIFGLKRTVLDPTSDPHRSELKKMEGSKKKAIAASNALQDSNNDTAPSASSMSPSSSARQETNRSPSSTASSSSTSPQKCLSDKHAQNKGKRSTLSTPKTRGRSGDHSERRNPASHEMKLKNEGVSQAESHIREANQYRVDKKTNQYKNTQGRNTNGKSTSALLNDAGQEGKTNVDSDHTCRDSLVFSLSPGEAEHEGVSQEAASTGKKIKPKSDAPRRNPERRKGPTRETIHNQNQVRESTMKNTEDSSSLKNEGVEHKNESTIGPSDANLTPKNGVRANRDRRLRKNIQRTSYVSSNSSYATVSKKDVEGGQNMINETEKEAHDSAPITSQLSNTTVSSGDQKQTEHIGSESISTQPPITKEFKNANSENPPYYKKGIENKAYRYRQQRSGRAQDEQRRPFYYKKEREYRQKGKDKQNYESEQQEQ